jgi:methylmalonyl-CoA mutase C-terminal domain/subunit
MELLAEQRLNDILVIVGGIIPDADVPKLRAIGIDGIFLPGTPMKTIVDFIGAKVGSPDGGAVRRTLL